MAFLRVVEVFPPLFPASRSGGARLDLDEKVESFVQGVRSIRHLGDVFLVANVKNPKFLKLSAVEASAILQERLGVEAAPVIVVRDMNRLQYLSTVLTCVTLGLRSIMIAWGDRYPTSAKATNVRDFSDLGEAIRQAALVRKRAGAPTRIFAPVDVRLLAHSKGVATAKGRLRAGADYLLAQPPTADPWDAFDRDASVLKDAGLKDRVLLNVFPFQSGKDVRACERYFGWTLPKSLHQQAAEGERSLVQMERSIAKRLMEEGFPGVYIITRGSPNNAEKLMP